MSSLVFYILGKVLFIAAEIYLTVLIVRMIVDWTRYLARNWKPRGVILLIANLIYTLTDPPIKFLRRFIPPLRLGGGLALDVGFLIVVVAVICVRYFGAVLMLVGR